MKQVIYAMQFKGNAAPKVGVSGVIIASTAALSCTLSSVVGPDGVAGTLLTVPGEKASFESEVTLTGDTSFKEAGTIYSDSDRGFDEILDALQPLHKSDSSALQELFREGSDVMWVRFAGLIAEH
jgi:hypothetical protein